MAPSTPLFRRLNASTTVNLEIVTRLYTFGKTFAYGKHLAKEALDLTFRHPNTTRWKTSPERVPAERILSLFDECSKWSPLEWLSTKNWTRVRDVLAEIIFPHQFRAFGNEGFKFKGFRANSFGRETLEFTKKVANAWKQFNRKSTSTRFEIQSCIDLLAMIIKESLMDASLRKDGVEHLVHLCQKYRHIPKALELEDLMFEKDASIKVFDRGGCADIMLADLGGEKVVVKVLRADKALRNKKRNRKWSDLHEEAINWIGLDFPGINPFLGITLKHPREDLGIGLVFKFQESGNSVRYLEKHPIDRLSFVQTKSFYLTRAVHYLHQLGLIHADIKGANILVDSNENLVLTDFGLMMRKFPEGTSTPGSVTSCSDDSNGTSLSGVYTLRFASKARLNGERSEQDDVWAIGMTFIELLTGKPPFVEKYENDLSFLMTLMGSKLDVKDARLPENIPEDLYNVIKRCIAPRPEDRPSTFELFSLMGQIAGGNALESVMRKGYS